MSTGYILWISWIIKCFLLPFECYVRKVQGSREVLVLNGPVMCADDDTLFGEILNALKEKKGVLDVLKKLVWQ